MSPQAAQIMIRPAYADDYGALETLAALDSADAVPPRPLLIVEVDGVLRAALSIRDGSAIADPFFPTAGLMALLSGYAAAGHAKAPERRPWRRRLSLGRPRLAHG